MILIETSTNTHRKFSSAECWSTMNRSSPPHVMRNPRLRYDFVLLLYCTVILIHDAHSTNTHRNFSSAAC